MKKRISSLLFPLYCFLFTLHSSLLIAGESGIGTATAVFLKIPTGARPAAMGSAFTGISDDINSFWWNPAGAVHIQSIEVLATQSQGIENINNTYIAMALPFRKHTFGIAITYLSAGDIEIRDDFGILQSGKNNVYDMATSIIYSRSLSKMFSMGITLKSITQKYASDTGSGIAFDIGILEMTRSLSIGLNIQNLGSNVKFGSISNELPTNVKLGFGYRLGEILLIGLDIDSPKDSGVKIHTGVEIPFRKKFFIRAGYDQIDSKFNLEKGLTVGLGMIHSNEMVSAVEEEGIGTLEMESETEGPKIKLPDMKFDYNLTKLGELGLTHRFSVSVKF